MGAAITSGSHSRKLLVRKSDSLILSPAHEVLSTPNHKSLSPPGKVAGLLLCLLAVHWHRVSLTFSLQICLAVSSRLVLEHLGRRGELSKHHGMQVDLPPAMDGDTVETNAIWAKIEPYLVKKTPKPQAT